METAAFAHRIYRIGSDKEGRQEWCGDDEKEINVPPRTTERFASSKHDEESSNHAKTLKISLCKCENKQRLLLDFVSSHECKPTKKNVVCSLSENRVSPSYPAPARPLSAFEHPPTNYVNRAMVLIRLSVLALTRLQGNHRKNVGRQSRHSMQDDFRLVHFQKKHPTRVCNGMHAIM